jgi:type II secretory pathway component GspD/PulD (secretin)
MFRTSAADVPTRSPKLTDPKLSRSSLILGGAPIFILSGALLAAATPRTNRPAPAPQPVIAQADEPPPAGRAGRPQPEAPPEAVPDEPNQGGAEDKKPEAPPVGPEMAPDAPVVQPEAVAPAPAQPNLNATPDALVIAPGIAVSPSAVKSRRPSTTDSVPGFGFVDYSVDKFVQYIVKWTGKTVVVRPTVRGMNISVFSERTMTTDEALAVLYEAFRLSDVGVIETDSMVLLEEISQIKNKGRRIQLTEHDDVMALTDEGNFYNKVFQLHHTKVENIEPILEDALGDFATPAYDANTNKLVIYGADLGLLKQIHTILKAIDQPPRIQVEKATFRLQYADAQAIADNLRDIYEGSTANRPNTPRTGGAANQPRGGRQPQSPGGTAPEGAVGVSEQLRITVLPAINTLTVSAEPPILKEIREQIVRWDIPRPEGITKVYSLTYADPLIVRDALQNILQGGSSGVRAGSRAGGRGGAGGAIPGGGGAEGGADVAVANLYKIEAFGDRRQLVVISKTPESLDWLDALVAALDQPTTIGMPILVPLKYAQAVEVSEQLNILFAHSGAQASLSAPDEGLRFQASGTIDDEGAAGGSTTGGTRGGSADGSGGAASGVINFPWLSSREGDGEVSPESEIIGKVRIVPIVRQNALSVLATPEYQQAVLDIISTMDRPGRQVMIAATIAQIELRDEFAWGLRVSSTDISPALADNFISGGIDSQNTEDGFLSVFDTSVLNANFDLNASLQALDQKTDVKILQQPKIFTADNQEAIFFQGQQIPFITDSVVTDVGGVTQSFDYKDVGVTLAVRPRITVERDVSMDIYFQLSNTVPGQTLFGAQIIDKRETETQVVVQNGQTIVISGIRIESETNIDRRFPVLGHIPLLGALFTSTDKSKVVNELLIFITPLVVDNPSENDSNFNENDRKKLEEVAQPLKAIKEQRRKGVAPIEAPTIGRITADAPAEAASQEEPETDVDAIAPEPIETLEPRSSEP